MSNFSFETRVNAPPAQVFDVFADLTKAPDRIDQIKALEVLTDGPIGVGTRFRETRVMFKKEATEEMEITAFEPGVGYRVECESCGSHFVSDFRFAPDGDGTKVETTMDIRPQTLMAKLMSPLGVLMAGSMKKHFQADLDQLKAVCEA